MNIEKTLDDLAQKRCAQALKYPADEMLLLSIMRALAVESAAAVRDIKGEFDELFDNSANIGRAEKKKEDARQFVADLRGDT